jgi:hypothetical protein
MSPLRGFFSAALFHCYNNVIPSGLINENAGCNMLRRLPLLIINAACNRLWKLKCVDMESNYPVALSKPERHYSAGTKEGRLYGVA